MQIFIGTVLGFSLIAFICAYLGMKFSEMNINYFKITKENAIEFVALKTLFLILSILMIVLTLSVIVAGVRGTAWEYHVTNDTAGETNITYHSAIENYGMVDVTFSLWIWVLVVTVFIMIVALIYQVLKMVSK